MSAGATAATEQSLWSVRRRYRAVAAEVSRNRADHQIEWLRRYASTRINSRLIDERRCVPPYIALDFANEGLFGMLIEERFGGQAMRMSDIARVLEQLAAVDLGLGTWVLTSVFPGTRPLAQWATEEIRAEWLPRLAAGRVYGAYAQTEPDAGSDFTRIGAAARPVAGGWELSGRKHWIGNGSWAGIVSVIAQIVEDDGSAMGIGAFAVPMSARGMRPGAEHLSLGLRGMVQSGVEMDAVPVTAGNLLGEQGLGTVVAVDSMTMTRLAIAASSLGAMKRVLQLAHRYTTRRRVSDGPLSAHGQVRTMLGEIAAYVDAAESLVYWLTGVLDEGQPVEMEPVAAAKVLTTEWLGRATDCLVQLLGGRGYDEENLAAQLYRDARVYRIFEGASEALVDFLGARAVTQPERVVGLLIDMGAADVAARLRDVLAETRERAVSSPVDKDVRKALAGTALMWGFAVATTRGRPDAGARTVAFVEHRFERALAAARTNEDNEFALASPDELDHAVSRFARSIGDIEQTLPGARIGIDPLLMTGAQH